MKQIPPMRFFKRLKWIDGRPLPDVIEPYRQEILTTVLYTFDGDRPQYNQAVTGRGKKNWKTADLIFAAVYRLLAWKSPQGNDGFLLANDEDQAKDDLELAKKLFEANPILAREVEIQTKEIRRKDGKGVLKILPAKDVAGTHGKTYLFVGFDEIHEYRSWDLFEALAPDPTRLDALTWITSYASIFNTPGYPLYDLCEQGRKGQDPRMFYSWYSAGECTDPDFASLSPEQKANPSMASWGNPGYLGQQKRRLPTHKYRRLHLNLPGMPEGAYFDAEAVVACVVEGRKALAPVAAVQYRAFVDMAGGSNDDATLSIAHESKGRLVVDLVCAQTGRPPFNPRQAVRKFAKACEAYNIGKVVGDAYAGQTFRQDFEAEGLSYSVSQATKSQLYEMLEPRINAGEVELPDIPRLHEQILGLTVRGSKIDHLAGEHDDWINAVAGAVELAQERRSFDWTSLDMRFGWAASRHTVGGHTPGMRKDL